jgi:nucleotide-binding universal stress UspA family protein
MSQEDTAVGLLERLGFPTGHTAKIIDGQHPVHTSASGNTPKPDMLPLPAGDDAKGIHCGRNVLVALSGTDLDIEIVTLACNLAKAKKSNVFAIYGIEVPRKLAIDAEMPTETQVASAALERAAGVAEQLHVRIEPEIIQSRHYGQSMVDEANAHECALLILGLPYHLGVGGHFDLGETADFVLKNAPCRVWLVRGQRTEVTEGMERREIIGATR